MGRGHPIVASLYDPVLQGAERAFLGALRAGSAGEARGRVIELGAGTGLNFRHYAAPRVQGVVAVEPDPHMRRRAVPRALGAAVPIRLVAGVAEALPLRDGCADAIVAAARRGSAGARARAGAAGAAVDPAHRDRHGAAVLTTCACGRCRLRENEKRVRPPGSLCATEQEAARAARGRGRAMRAPAPRAQPAARRDRLQASPGGGPDDTPDRESVRGVALRMKAPTSAGRKATRAKPRARATAQPRAKAKAKPGTGSAARAGAPRKAAAKARKSASSRRAPAGRDSASRLIDGRIAELADWRGATLARMRALLLGADPQLTEEWKWRGTPVWSRHGIVCTGETYAKVVKLTFARGAALPDPARLFNSSLEGNTRRAIDIREGESIDARAFKALVKAAVAHNAAPAGAKRGALAGAGTRGKTARKTQGAAGAAAPRRTARKSRPPSEADAKVKPARARKGEAGAVVLLAGGNPQVAKGDGDAPVQAYIAAIPGWKREVARRLDALIERAVPAVRKAVKWNSALYGVEGQGFFLSFHVYTNYVKLAFYRGAALQPLPPGPSKDPNTRYLDLREADALDEAQLASWLRQAAALPGWIPGRRA